MNESEVRKKHRKVKMLLIGCSLVGLILLSGFLRINATNKAEPDNVSMESEKLVKKEQTISNNQFMDINILSYGDRINLYDSTGKELDTVTTDHLIDEAKNTEISLIQSNVEDVKEELSIAIQKLDKHIKNSINANGEANKLKSNVDKLYDKLIAEEVEAQKRIEELSSSNKNKDLQIFDKNSDGIVLVLDDILVLVKPENNKIKTQSIKNGVVKSFKDVIFDENKVIGKVDAKNLILIDLDKNTIKEIKTTNAIKEYIVLDNNLVYSTSSTINILDMETKEEKVFDFSANTRSFIKDDKFVYAINEYGKAYGKSLIAKIDANSKQIVALESYNGEEIDFVMINNGLIIDEGSSLRVVNRDDLKSESVLGKSSKNVSAYVGRNGIFEFNDVLRYRDLKTKDELKLDLNINSNYKVLVK